MNATKQGRGPIVSTTLSIIAFAGIMTSSLLALEEPGWYVFELEENVHLTGRLMKAEEDFYVLNFQGSVLQLARSKVLGLKKPSLPAGTKAEEGEAHSDSAARAEQVLDAIEALGSLSDGERDQAYGALGRDLEISRPFLHAALSHQKPRVRALAIKLLGEVGTAGEDLEPVTSRLSDSTPQVRLASIMAMRRLGPRGAPALVDHLQREAIPNNRKMAVQTLQFWNSRGAVGPLLELQAVEKDRGVRRCIEVALESLIGRRGRSPGAWEAHLKKMREAPTRPPQDDPETGEGAPRSGK